MVMRGTARDYLERHPGPGDVLLVVEVADTSQRQDRESKKRLYDRAGIAVYWIVNLVESQIEVYTEPRTTARRSDYRLRRDYKPDDMIPVVLDGAEIGSLAVRELLP
jgi:Uma2 family endonuclease